MAFTLELTADYHAPQGRIVTDHTTATLPSLSAALAVTDATWQRVGRRRGTQLHVRITPDHGTPIVTRRFRRD